MPRKKTTPTVATTEPDTTLNPDRAQVAAVADLPHAPEPAVSFAHLLGGRGLWPCNP